jgi:ribonuclease HI
MSTKRFYTVRIGKIPGVYNNWPSAKAQIDGVQGAKYKGFPDEASALAWLNEGGGPKSVLFDIKPAVAPVTSQQPIPGLPGGPLWQPIPGAKPYAFTPAFTPTPGAIYTAPVTNTIVVPQPSTLEYEKGVHVWVDGSHVKGEAGWGFLVDVDGVTIEEQCGPVATGPNGEKPTNNRGELWAILNALTSPKVKELTAQLTGDAKITFHSDSEYSINTFTKWIDGWARKGWLTATGKPVSNQDLIKTIYNEYDKTKHVFHHVYGHVGIKGNERADFLCNEGRKMSSSSSVSAATVTPSVTETPATVQSTGYQRQAHFVETYVEPSDPYAGYSEW